MCPLRTVNSRCLPLLPRLLPPSPHPNNERVKTRTGYFERNFIMMIVRYTFFPVRSTAVFALLCALCMAVSAQTPAPVRYDSGTISGLAARNIGSATMGGRISVIDAVDENGKITVFVGSASGGVWKSINGATTFRPVFDREPAQSIGAVTIDPS